MSNINFDHMEYGNNGWVPLKNGGYRNLFNEHMIDEDGKEYDANGNLVYDPSNE